MKLFSDQPGFEKGGIQQHVVGSIGNAMQAALNQLSTQP
jgi:hypothetical protein